MPQFDITANCRAEISTISGVSESLQQCVSDEQTARDALQPEWSGFIAHDQRECLQETGMDGTPSYVELKICLEMARDARRMRKNNT
ncbi:hypothetical protein [Bradyrhizobium sp. dw_78]|uniref:hypothetical protein n=1 Tax=Bradyrhizobium sp. dw_78 TaxID=2719793 RepID=UPI001BD3229D|nr:hypothetical protein [Bradyrhizobium sp. dw_78]